MITLSEPDVILICQDRDCGQSFLSSDPERKYCDRCFCDRINGAGIFEDDDDEPESVELPAPAPAPVATTPAAPATVLHWTPAIRALAQLGLTPDLFRAACAQWQAGCPVFGLWAAKHVRPWDVRAYRDLIGLVRLTLDDRTDYSREEL